MSSKRKSKLKKRIFMIVAVVIVLLLVVGVALQPKKTSYESVDAKTGDINTYYTFSGNVETKNRETVLSESVLQMKDIKVKEGDIVKEGDVLFTTTTDDKIKAKINGEVSKINVEENAQVMAGTSLMEIVDYDNLQISVKVDEYDMAELKVGEEATVSIGAIDKEVNGTIQSISKEGQVVNGVTFFTAVIDLAKDEDVRVGMSAEVKVAGESAKSVVILPMNVIQFDNNNQPYVYLMDDKGKVVNTTITTGINDGTNVEITSGINSGDVVYYKDNSSTTSGGFGFGGRNGGNNQ
ncbi:MAG TPA: HlyD family efflux transporter periplasmic adaptor subunit [Mobilitalea sp.]|nr:HlyD family efflux transporter periplasmic adaptor subunit [Mobilitalea sp.]